MRNRIELDTRLVEGIFSRTIEALNGAQGEMREIVEAARRELETLTRELEQVRQAMEATVARVDELEQELRHTRQYLARVARAFYQYSRDEIRAAYEQAEEVQVRLAQERVREKGLRERRDDLERRARGLTELIARAESILTRLCVARDFLTGNSTQLREALQGLKDGYEVGLRVIRAQEEERRRVAREIHDGPAQQVANLVLRAEICERLLAPGSGVPPVDGDSLRRELDNLKRMARESLQEIRRIISDLRPMALDDLGLVPALRRFLARLREEGVPVELEILGAEERLVPAAEVALFRVVQEAVHNAARHARASRIRVRLEFRPLAVQLSVEDDGEGFEPRLSGGTGEGEPHFGLISMRERVHLLGGEWWIDAAPGRGTRIRARLPRGKEGSPSDGPRTQAEPDPGPARR